LAFNLVYRQVCIPILKQAVYKARILYDLTLQGKKVAQERSLPAIGKVFCLVCKSKQTFILLHKTIDIYLRIKEAWLSGPPSIRLQSPLALARGCIQVGKRDFSKKPLKKLFIREEVFTLLPLDEYELKTMMRQTIIMITKA